MSQPYEIEVEALKERVDELRAERDRLREALMIARDFIQEEGYETEELDALLAGDKQA